MLHTLARRLLLFLIILAIISTTVASRALLQPDTMDSPDSLKLQPPAFVMSAYAQDAAPSSFLDNEAGISAYFQAPFPINLNNMRTFYRTIEAETQDYLIGSVAVEGYKAEEEDVHVYIHKDGWVLTYYLKADPASKIIDWGKYSGGAILTKFDTVLGTIAANLGIASPTFTYYHFQYPNATDLALIAEFIETNQTGSFKVNLPSQFGYFERSWSIGCKAVGYSRYYLNETKLHDESCASNTYTSFSGTIAPIDLLPDKFHTIRVTGYDKELGGGMVLLYRRGP